MSKRDSLQDAINRLETLIELKQTSARGEALLVMVSIRDIERVIHAAIWGDD